jgi:hypothetical protein
MNMQSAQFLLGCSTGSVAFAFGSVADLGMLALAGDLM